MVSLSQTLLNEVVQHLSDIQKVQDTGDELSQAQPTIARQTTATVNDIVVRYRALEGKITEELDELRNALTASQGLEDNLDMLLQWLLKAEADAHKMDKGTLLVVQKEPLLDNMELQQVSVTCLEEKVTKRCLEIEKFKYILMR